MVEIIGEGGSSVLFSLKDTRGIAPLLFWFGAKKRTGTNSKGRGTDELCVVFGSSRSRVHLGHSPRFGSNLPPIKPYYFLCDPPKVFFSGLIQVPTHQNKPYMVA